MRVNILSLLRSGKHYGRLHSNCFGTLERSLILSQINISNATAASHFCTTKRLYKFVPDKSKVPTFDEKDIEEQFVSGSGPGGQNVNRLQNCVVLRHIPTGIVVRCHEDRLMQRNRKLARQLLIDRLDQHFNGENSVAEQKKRYLLARNESRQNKAAELRSMKKQYQESLKTKRSADDSTESSASPDEESHTLKQ